MLYPEMDKERASIVEKYRLVSCVRNNSFCQFTGLYFNLPFSLRFNLRYHVVVYRE